MDDALTFDATVAKVQTLVDNGLRVTLDLPEHEILSVAMLMTYKRENVPLRITAQPTPCKTDDNRNATIPERAKRKSQWTASQE